MSTYDIEYRHLVLAFDGFAGKMRVVKEFGEVCDSTPDLCLALVEKGSSADWTSNSSRRPRSWSIYMIGSHRQILDRACNMAREVNSGDTRLGSHRMHWTTPEAYIRHIRKAVTNAVPVHEAAQLLAGQTITWHAWQSSVGGHPWLGAVQAEGRLTEDVADFVCKLGETRRWSLRFTDDATAVDRIAADVLLLAHARPRARDPRYAMRPVPKLVQALDGVFESRRKLN